MSTMTTFHAVNHTALVPNDMMDHHDDATTPTTPRPSSSTITTRNDGPGPAIINNEDAAPKQENGGVAGQRALPTSPFPGASSGEGTPGTLSRENSQKSILSDTAADDMDMDDSDDDQDGSGSETDGEPGRPSKKKKGQRFFCTQYPPCTLSFTRSEHLARHIRKHTGERPFQCHCARRFSRLDNLRQHAQTVHLNEEIPNDSLAATGTRFQRQIRTDRVRPPGGRARSGTGGSQGGHSRGHSRNLSTSSVGSTASNFSTNQEPRRRPPPLIMANDPSARARLSLDTMGSPPNTPPNQYRSAQSPGGMTTPTSATFSNGPGSPYYGSSMGSPASNASRVPGHFASRAPARRLSVPSGANPFQSPHGNTYPPPYVSPLASSNASYSSAQSSVYASPTASTYGFARNDPNIAADADWRRRTWHPSTHSYHPRPATSGLSFFQTPDAPQPAFAQNATAAAGQGQAPRLPGIESFDRPSTPPRRGPSPMQIDAAPAPPFHGTPSNQGAQDPRRGHVSWDMSLHSNLTRLDLRGSQLKDVSQWGQQTLNEIEHAAQRPLASYQQSTAGRPGPPVIVHQQQQQQQRAVEVSQPDPATPTRSSKRRGWYNGPYPPTHTVQPSRPSPEDSSSSDGVPTPGTSAAEIHPAIMHSSGYIEPHHHVVAAEMNHNACAPSLRPGGYHLPQHNSSQPLYVQGPPNPQNDISRLEALVAVATGEDKVVTAR